MENKVRVVTFLLSDYSFCYTVPGQYDNHKDLRQIKIFKI